jgi:hypothetical protein
MFFPIASPVRRQAKSAHELAMVNLILVNLLMLIALLAGSFLQHGSPLVDYKLVGVLVPFFVSLAIIAFTFIKAARLAGGGPWFVAAHWRLATNRYKILLIAYAVGAGLIGTGWLLSMAQKSAGMQELMFVALQRVAIAPVLIALMVLIMLESGALYQAGRGEVPDSLITRFPPPADLRGGEAEFVSEVQS